MIKLFCFGPHFGVADPSPFVLKVATYMKMAGIEFESHADIRNLQRAPKGKLPYIEDDGELVADSFFIIKHLEKKYGAALDGDLSDQQLATSSLLAKSLDENFSWCIVHSRWVGAESWPTVKQALFGGMPFPLRYIVPVMARKKAKNALQKHAVGQYSDAQRMVIAENTLRSLSVLLADKQYIFGDKPCALDAIVYGFVVQVALSTLDNPLNQLAVESTNLVDYCQRITERYYPELAVV